MWQLMAAQAAGAAANAMKAPPSGANNRQDANVSGRGEVGFDSSGWNVNFGNGAVQGAGGGSKPVSLLLYAALAVGALIVWKKLKSK